MTYILTEEQRSKIKMLMHTYEHLADKNRNRHNNIGAFAEGVYTGVLNILNLLGLEEGMEK